MSEYGIKPFRPDDDWLLPPLIDPESAKLRELQQKVAGLPAPVLAFGNGKANQEIILAYPPTNDGGTQSQLRNTVGMRIFKEIAYNPFFDGDREYSKRRVIDYLEKEYLPFAKDWLDFHQLQAAPLAYLCYLATRGLDPQGMFGLNYTLNVM